MQLYLIRHAQSANNSKPEAERVEDPEITELGHQQAAALARSLTTQKVDYLVTSGFLRTLQTTRYLAEALQAPVNVWRDLHEVGGCYRGHIPGQEQGAPGMNRDAILAEFPGVTIEDSIGAEGWWGCRPYETDDQAMQRGQQMLAQIVEQFAATQKVVVAVIHADFKVCLLRHILGQEFTQRHIGPMLNTGLTKFTFSEAGWRLDILNSITHLTNDQMS
ncbi:bifunctional RNase H/acid phosphatase [Rosistilla carotiformis]|uniref:Bifunctional RNase H/acid phosphatase n=1 Tax=Rosistilla carotiformis TaxID=2528017 RepID=A0A518JRH5_9BACT|nr:histidine phosphatase family protein [Rosistilla carotiformis]QDV68139.1 bifunctional RNase H/acid phosphatase [Rosistilla carotiformis]